MRTDELDELMIAVYRQMRARRHWIRAAAAHIGVSYLTLDRLLSNVTRAPEPETLDRLYRYAYGRARPRGR